MRTTQKIKLFSFGFEILEKSSLYWELDCSEREKNLLRKRMLVI